MPDVEAYEKFGSRGRSRDLVGEDSTAELTYIITGTSNDDIVINTAELQMPVLYEGLERTSISVEQVGLLAWEATATFKDPEREDEEEGDEQRPENGETVWSFDTSGDTFTLQFTKNVAGDDPYRQRKGHSSLSDSPRLFGAINYDGEEVNGTDIIIPSLRITCRTVMNRNFVSIDWIKTVAGITGTTNNGPFYGFDRGELLFLGATGEESLTDSERDPEVTFTFAAQENQTEIPYETINGDVTIDKRGWEYLWLYYQKTEDTSAKTLTPKVVDVYVNQVYDESDFGVLGIGTS